MKQSEFLRWLKAQGVEVAEGSKHTKLIYKGRKTIIPRHPGREIKKGTVEAIKKQLGLE